MENNTDMDGKSCNSGSEVPENFHDKNHEQSGSGKLLTCEFKDDDLLVSAILKCKRFMSTCKRSIHRSERPSKQKNQMGSCNLPLQSPGRGGGQRTVLSWLCCSGCISLGDVIQFCVRKTNIVVKEGVITLGGIFCKCCNKVVSLFEFKIHAGFRVNRACLNLFMESGKPFALCQLEAWSAEYKAKKVACVTDQNEEVDDGDDYCGCCGIDGDLIGCDNCPSAFHRECLYIEEIPDGNWYCRQCTCQICSNGVDKKEVLLPLGMLKCSQCQNHYHEACVKKCGCKLDIGSDTWCCSKMYQEAYLGLQAQIGTPILLSDGFHWTLLKCVEGDQKAHSSQSFVALKAECNSRLAVALQMMEEYFIPMVDPRSGVNRMTQLVYNWGSMFPCVDYSWFYTAVLEKGDTLIALASIRIHGVTVAEMPFAATCIKHHHQGMFRRLLQALLLMLKSLKVEKLIVAAILSTVETWKAGFGFANLEDHDKQSLSKIKLMAVPGSKYLKRSICEN